MLLAEVSQFTATVDSKFLFDSWQKYSGNVAMETGSPLVQILITIGNAARKLSRIAIEDIRGMHMYISCVQQNSSAIKSEKLCYMGLLSY